MYYYRLCLRLHRALNLFLHAIHTYGLILAPQLGSSYPKHVLMLDPTIQNVYATPLFCNMHSGQLLTNLPILKWL